MILRILPALFAALLLAGPASAGTGKLDAQLEPVLAQYLAAHDALASDKLEGVPEAGRKIAALAKKLQPKSVKGPHAGHFDALPKQLAAAGEALAQAKTLEAARAAFRELSLPLVMWARMAGPEGVNVMHCSMYQGGSEWLQKTKSVRNPYYGSQMLACGELVSSPAQGAADHAGH